MLSKCVHFQDLADEIGSDPLDRVIPLKSAPSQRPPNEMASVRHSVVHVPTEEIVASPGCYEIRENETKRILFYGPIESLCYKTAEKTVGGVIYDVHPFIRLELAPLTNCKFSVRLSSVHCEKKAESNISESAHSSSSEGHTTFLLRWDKHFVQVSCMVASYFLRPPELNCFWLAIRIAAVARQRAIAICPDSGQGNTHAKCGRLYDCKV